MSLYVVDASVAIKLYVPEVHSAQAIRFFSDAHELIVPEFMLAEVANIVWKKISLIGGTYRGRGRGNTRCGSRNALRLLLHEWVAL